MSIEGEREASPRLQHAVCHEKLQRAARVCAASGVSARGHLATHHACGDECGCARELHRAVTFEHTAEPGSGREVGAVHLQHSTGLGVDVIGMDGQRERRHGRVVKGESCRGRWRG